MFTAPNNIGSCWQTMLHQCAQTCSFSVHIRINVETPVFENNWLTENECTLAYLKLSMYIRDSILFFLSVQQRAQGNTPLTCSGWFGFYRTHKFQVYTCILFPGAEEDQLFSPTCHTQDVHRGVWQTHSCWCGPVDNGIKRLLVDHIHKTNNWFCVLFSFLCIGHVPLMFQLSDSYIVTVSSTFFYLWPYLPPNVWLPLSTDILHP